MEHLRMELTRLEEQYPVIEIVYVRAQKLASDAAMEMNDISDRIKSIRQVISVYESQEAAKETAQQ